MTTKQIKALDNYFFRTRTTTTVAGKQITWKQFQRRFKGIFPELAHLNNTRLRDSLKIVAIYADINKVLKFRGMAIKSVDYYSHFKLVENTTKKVDDIAKTTLTRRKYSVALSTGIAAYSNEYSAKLSSKEIGAIKGQSSPQVARITY